MTWPARIGVGVAILAALAAGHAIDAGVPVDDTDDRPFVHTAGVGDRVQLTYADVTVDAVRTAKTLAASQFQIGTPGRWLVVDVTVVAWRHPLTKPGVSLEDARGRSFGTDSRTGYSWETAPTGVPWRTAIPFEVPQDGLQGATLVFSRSALDDRRDDVARIDLGIGPGDVTRLWRTEDTIEIRQPEIGSS